MWPTPSAQQAGEGDFIQTLQTKDGEPAEPGQRAYSPKTGKHSQVTLNRAVKMWPTPNARQKGGGEYKDPQKILERMKKGRQKNLGDMVKLWPTPTANEDAAGTPNGKMQKMLGKHPDIRGATSEEWQSGSLNPAWVEWLMGYPVGWTDLKD
jgi:hypothetical protein